MTRLLPREDWRSKLVGTELEAAVPYLELEPSCHVLVDELPDGTVIGCWAAVQYWHVEGLWIHPAHRRTGRVARRGVQAMWTLLRSLGVRAVITGADRPEIADLARRMGGEQLPGVAFVMPVRQE